MRHRGGAWRDAARHVKAFHEICALGHFNYHDTYGGMSLDNRTDKSLSVSGKTTREYLDRVGLRKLHCPAEAVHKIVPNGEERMLKPERRFDAAVAAQLKRDERKKGKERVNRPKNA